MLCTAARWRAVGEEIKMPDGAWPEWSREKMIRKSAILELFQLGRESVTTHATMPYRARETMCTVRSGIIHPITGNNGLGGVSSVVTQRWAVVVQSPTSTS